jgi:hypothetical protein
MIVGLLALQVGSRPGRSRFPKLLDGRAISWHCLHLSIELLAWMLAPKVPTSADDLTISAKPGRSSGKSVRPGILSIARLFRRG